eukprot:967923-Lingulodinium_polyedra.AAC.1
MQSDISIHLLLDHRNTGERMCWCIPLSCPLQFADRSTATVIKASFAQQYDVPGLRAVLAMFPFTMSASTADRAKANDTCED